MVIACCLVGCSSKSHGTVPPDAIACSNDGMCPPTTPYCNTSAGYCVDCIGDTNCGTGRYCSKSQQCVHCLTDAQCSGTTPYCTLDGDCVECIDTTQCTSGQSCNAATNRCVAGCGSNGDCATPTAVCNTTAMYCVQCLASTDCSAPTAICDPSDDTCVGCLADTDCKTAPRLKCNTTNQMCVQCLTAADCPTGRSCTFGTCR